MSNDDMESSLETRQSVPFTHFVTVANSFDHNIQTLDGLGTFHEMSIIAATVSCGSFVSAECRIICAEMPMSAAIKDMCAFADL